MNGLFTMNKEMRLFFDIQEATKFATENGLSLIYVMQKSEELRNNEHLNIVYQ